MRPTAPPAAGAPSCVARADPQRACPPAGAALTSDRNVRQFADRATRWSASPAVDVHRRRRYEAVEHQRRDDFRHYDIYASLQQTAPGPARLRGPFRSVQWWPARSRVPDTARPSSSTGIGNNGSLTKVDTWQTQNGLGTNGILVVPFIPDRDRRQRHGAAQRDELSRRPAWSTRKRLAISTQPCDLNPTSSRRVGQAMAVGGSTRRSTTCVGTSPVSGITGKPTAVALTPGVQYYINLAERQGVNNSRPRRHAVVRLGPAVLPELRASALAGKAAGTLIPRPGFHACPALAGRVSFSARKSGRSHASPDPG